MGFWSTLAICIVLIWSASRICRRLDKVIDAIDSVNDDVDSYDKRVRKLKKKIKDELGVDL